MSEPGSAANPIPSSASKMFTELKASAHLMTFETGLYCIVQTPGLRRVDDGSGLPGVRISLPPSPAQNPGAVTINSFRDDGWMSGAADATLVRVSQGPAQLLVTIYQAPGGPEAAPRLQVLRLSEDPAAAAAAGSAQHPKPASGAEVGAAAPPRQLAEVVAHVQTRGDVGALLGDWIGEKGSKRWIEGFIVAPQPPILPADIEYQAVLGRGWLSPWVEGTNLCGSRGMALPILGLRLRVRGEAAKAYEVSYSATFVDGSEIGPVVAGEPCEAESLAPMEAFQLVFKPRGDGGEATAEIDGPSAAARTAPRGIRGKVPGAKRPR